MNYPIDTTQRYALHTGESLGVMQRIPDATYPTERRSHPRTSSTPCPHCGMTRLEGHHFSDSGELPADEAKAAGFCPVLAERRRSQVPAEISRIDARIAEAIAAGWTEEEPNYAAALAAEADWGAQ